MFTALIILIVIASVLMIGIVLIQKSKGGGLASNFASYNQIGGVRKTTSFVEKATWTLMGIIAVLCIICTVFFSHVRVSSEQSAIREQSGVTLPAMPENVSDSIN